VRRYADVKPFPWWELLDPVIDTAFVASLCLSLYWLLVAVHTVPAPGWLSSRPVPDEQGLAFLEGSLLGCVVLYVWSFRRANASLTVKGILPPTESVRRRNARFERGLCLIAPVGNALAGWTVILGYHQWPWQ